MTRKILLLLSILIIFIGLVLYFNKKQTNPSGYACTMEAKICPDGSAVGRSGPKCEFALCPGETKAGAHLNQKVSVGPVSITPLKVNSDSRCPVDVECFWAGTVSINAKVEINGLSEEKTLELGKTINFNSKSITLDSVTPDKKSKQNILDSDYVFTFSVK